MRSHTHTHAHLTHPLPLQVLGGCHQLLYGRVPAAEIAELPHLERLILLSVGCDCVRNLETRAQYYQRRLEHPGPAGLTPEQLQHLLSGLQAKLQALRLCPRGLRPGPYISCLRWLAADWQLLATSQPVLDDATQLERVHVRLES